MKAQRKNIVVPYNFTEESRIALENTYNIAKFINATIVLLYVIEPGDFFQELFKSKDIINKVEKEAYSKLEEVAETAKKNSNGEISTMVKRGKAYEQILQAADSINARFIILGKPTTQDKDKRTLGSTITRVVRQSSTPVIVMKGSEDCKIQYKNILLPVDLTKRTREKLFNAIAFAMHYGATIHLVSVLMGSIKARESRIYKKLRKMEKLIQEHGINTTMKLFNRTPTPIHQVILDYANEINADMILVMTHKESLTGDNYIGAVAYEIVNESDIPVLTLTSEAARESE